MTEELKKDIIQWDIKSWSKALYYWEKNISWDSIENALDLGAREGGLSLWLAKKNITTVCSDIKDIQKTAEPLHKHHKVNHLITYQDINATEIPYENHFDLIVFKSIIGGVGHNDSYENQKKAFNAIYKALKPGGKLLFAENLSASSLHHFLRKRFVKWGNNWRYVSYEEMNEMLQPFSSYEINTTGVLATFGRNEKQRSLLYSIDNLLLNNILPENWKYISYGIAVK